MLWFTDFCLRLHSERQPDTLGSGVKPAGLAGLKGFDMNDRYDLKRLLNRYRLRGRRLGTIAGLSGIAIVYMALAVFVYFAFRENGRIQTVIGVCAVLSAGCANLLLVATIMRSLRRSLSQQQQLNRRLGEASDTQKRLTADLEKRRETQQHMLNVITHELRTPAATIRMIAELPEIDRENQLLMRAGADQLLQAIDDLGHGGDPEFEHKRVEEAFCPSRLLDEVAALMLPVTSSGEICLQTESRIAQRDIRYLSDASRLRSILLNLVRNACYHSGGSLISIKVESTSLADGRHRVVFRVEDDGCGIPESETEELFLPHEHQMLSANGTGAGLDTLKARAQALGGEIVYFYSPLGGAGFLLTIDLPVATQKHPHLDRLSASGANETLGKLRILLVEDDAIIRKLVSKTLRTSLEATVSTAENGQQALSSLSRELPDLLITDYYMPILDGHELIVRLRESGTNLPIIGLTSASTRTEHEALLQAGADFVLTKPLNLSDLAEALAVLSDRGQLRDHNIRNNVTDLASATSRMIGKRPKPGH